jgi:Peptidase family M1 domain
VTRTSGLSAFPLVALAWSAPLAAGSRVPPVASYQIEASYAAGHRLTGKETVRFTNRTSRPLPDIQMHLYLNAWRNDRSTWLRRQAEGGGRRPAARGTGEEWSGYSELNRVALSDGTDLTSAIRFIAPDDGNANDRTVVSIALPRPVAPGETLVFQVDFEAKFPRTIARTGWKDDFLLAAQWFPKLGAATDQGWNCHQFHPGTEFFADFGDYDVTLTLPKEMKGKVGASGVLKEEADLPGDRVREHFVAEDVHDFAWTCSPRFEVHRETFTHIGLPNVEIVLLLQPDHRSVKNRYLRAVEEGLAHYGEWYIPYPYPTITVVDPPWGTAAGGMEYPTFFTGGTRWLAPRGSHSPEHVTVHEFGHQIFYGLLASNEFEEAHLDEGFDTYATNKTMKAAYGDEVFVERFYGIPFPFPSIELPYPVYRGRGFYDWQVKSRSDATNVPTFRNLDGRAVFTNAYAKTGLTLASCERTLGEATWARVMKTYATRWAFRHPTSADFRSVVKEVAGEKADELFQAAWDSSDTIDYAVTVAETKRVGPVAGYVGDGAARTFTAPRKEPNPGGGWESTVVIRRMGEAAWPVDVELRFASGETVRRAWDGKDRWIRYRITGPRLVTAVVDPDEKCLLDVNRLNNGRTVEKDGAAAARWAHRFRFWAQNLLEVFSLLGATVGRT